MSWKIIIVSEAVFNGEVKTLRAEVTTGPLAILSDALKIACNETDLLVAEADEVIYVKTKVIR